MTDSLANKWRNLNMLMKIIVINAAVFLILRLYVVFAAIFGAENPFQISNWVSMPSSPELLLRRPWTVLTYMFAQYDVMHVLFNMLWLYWFGMIFISLSTGKRLMGLYIYGGLAGALFFALAYNLLPGFHDQLGFLIGSSASVIAIVAASAVLYPDYKMRLLFIGFVSLKWLAIITIGIDILSIQGANAGGHIAHIGGAVIGVVYGLLMRRGIDITRPLNAIIDFFVNLTRLKLPEIKRPRRPRPAKASKRPTAEKPGDIDDLDRILDKIKQSGYTSLTPEERKRIFDVSSRIK